MLRIGNPDVLPHVAIGTNLTFGWTNDLSFSRDAANTLAQRNGLNAQESRIYSTYTDASNYERFFIKTNVGSTSATQIGLSAAGTGQNRSLEFVTGGSTRMTIASSGTITVGGSVVTSSNNGMRFVGVDEIRFSAGAGGDPSRIFISGPRTNLAGIPDGGLKVLNQSLGLATVECSNLSASGNIISMGNVGIGTSTPTAKLDILDTTLAGSGGLSGSALNIAQTWNTNLTPTALSVNVTDLSSNAASLLMDLQVGGVSKAKIDKTGDIVLINDSRGIYFSGNKVHLGIRGQGLSQINFIANASLALSIINNGGQKRTQIVSDGQLGFGADLTLVRDDANTLAQRNGGAAQTFRVYNTFGSRTVSDTTLETLEIKGVAANNFIIQSMRGTTGGVARDIEFRHGAVDTNGTVTNGTLIASIAASGLSVNGHFSATTKSFLIDNPVKGGKLQYGVVESNEHGVYIRGTTSESTIVLPDYWDWLVHEDSVTVTVTPVGKFQPLYVVSQDNKKVVVGGVEDKYNYTIYGTRKDVPELKVELEK
jgi:hypothetical protein